MFYSFKQAGLNASDLDNMTIAQAVEFVRLSIKNTSETPTATQADIDNF